MRLLAVAVAMAGHGSEAATVGGYSDANLRPHRLDAHFEWVQPILDDTLAGIADRLAIPSRGCGVGARSDHGLVTSLDSIIDHATPEADE